MRAVIVMAGRLLVAHWPALVAWFLIGTLGRYVGLEVAGFVGGYSALGGILILPLAILAKLVSVVAMFLVLRDGMVRLGVIAPAPTERAERRRAFRDAMLSSVLPFIAVYAALGFLREDVAAYLDTALQVKIGREFTEIVTGVDADTAGTVDALEWEPWTIAVVVLAFAGRWAWTRWHARLPRWTALAATYLEGLWVFLAAYFVGEAIGQVTGWVDSRQAISWLGDARAWVGDLFAPLGWAWDGIGWLLGELGGLLGVPLAWLAIAGIVYGQAVAPQGVQWRGELVERARERYGTVPQRLRRRLNDLGARAGSRFVPVWRAMVLMWRSGPILIGGYVLAYWLVILGEQWLRFGLIRLIGPQDFYEFWRVFGVAVLMLVPIVIEPIRTVVIASAYDATVGALIGAPAAPSGNDLESQDARQLVEEHDLDDERTGGIGGDDERHLDAERSGGV
ncbi:hypothetical protein [Microbacterium dauci]|uniref:Uncharacterized protein n=1 Tax=Microbacterium dauci TaxID=3048008 RepID=A0ABT6ZAF5_9MICO|nr:hypothetical protein [Microbacterium sp. LX3-4]MDJ1113142.1 hypothetical protein [Microbacterium sp. LX3-4]